jgi:hypothetical protein
LGGRTWKLIKSLSKRRFIANSYRVLLTRAREGMVIWVPQGSAEDETRDPAALDATASFLEKCGATPIVPSAGSTNSHQG